MSTNMVKTKKKILYTMLGLILIIAALCLGVFYLIKGQETTTGDFPGDTETVSLTCSNEGMLYPFFKLNSASTSNTTVKIIFNNDKLATIFLVNRMEYSSSDKAKVESDGHNGEMNISFGKLGANALGARYYVDGATAQMTLYASKDELSDITKKYFLIEDNPVSINEYEQNYAKQDFECKI